MRTSLVSGPFMGVLNTSIHILRKITSIAQKKTPGFPAGILLIVSTVVTAVKIPPGMNHDNLGV